MPTASLSIASFSKDRVDAEKGILYGCQLAKCGVTAVFADEEGNPKEIDITPTLINQLAQLANGKDIPAHWTHDYLNPETEEGKKDPLHSKIGVWKNVQVNPEGDLIGDLHLMPTQYREAVLWLADNTPSGAMTSAVFDYNDLGQKKAYPLNFKASDIVSKGAATTAMFSQINKKTAKFMEIEDLLQCMKDPQFKKALESILDSHEDDMDESESAAMEKDMGVEEADKKPEDDKKPAALRCALRCFRALKRQRAAQQEEILVKAEAKFSSAIGTRIAALNLSGNGNKDKTPLERYKERETAVMAALPAGKRIPAYARAKIAREEPELYAEYEKSLGPIR